MDKNCLLYYRSALDLKLNCELKDCINGFIIHLAKKRYYIRGANVPFNLITSVSPATNKFCVNKLLEESGIPVPKAAGISKKEFESNAFDLRDIKFPVVAKPPLDSGCGKDVFCNIKNEKILRDYLKKMFNEHEFMLIEEFQPNLRSYRVLVFCNKIIGVVERISAHVIGDGVHTLHTLIEMTNAKHQLLKDELSIGAIEMAEESQVLLQEMNMTINDIPQAGQRVPLCYKCNSGVGGTIRTAENEICPENTALVVKAARILELELVGFDVLCEDISKPIGPTRGFIIEANYNSDVTIHEKPTEGPGNCVTRTVLLELIKRHRFVYEWEKMKKYRPRILFFLKMILVLFSVFIFYRIT